MLQPSPADAPSTAAQIEGAIFGVVLVDPAGTVRQINPAAQEMLGLSTSRATGRPVFDCIRLSDVAVQEKIWAAQEGITVRDVVLADAPLGRAVNITSSHMAAHPGWRIVTVSQGSHGHEDDLSAAALRGPSVLAHEIKNPLAAIKGAGQLLARKSASESRELAQVIIDEADRIAKLVDRMQSLGRTTAEPLESCNQHEAIRSAIAAIRNGSGSGVAIHEEFDPSLPQVFANRDLLEQVLLNLLGNACDAAPGSDAEITVETRYSATPLMTVGRTGQSCKLPVEISVIDNGPGIDPMVDDQIFDPFVSTKGGGHGLGLPLVRKLMRDMGGRVTHLRHADRTYFRLHLPIAVNTEKETAQ